MLAQSEHAVESNSRMMASALVDGDAVDDVAFAQVFERPEEVLGVMRNIVVQTQTLGSSEMTL